MKYFAPIIIASLAFFHAEPAADAGIRLSGSHVYSALAIVDVGGRRDWISIASSDGRAPNLKELAQRAAIAPNFLANVRALLTPGVTIVLTEKPVNGRTHSTDGFKILTD